MSVSMTSSLLKPGRRSLQCRALFFLCYRRWQCRNFCCHHPVPVACGFLSSKPAHLPRLHSGVRWFSDNERDRNDDRGNLDLKGFVFRVPNPLAWLKDKWYTYRVQSLVDPLFNLREFQVGAKQVWLLFSCVSSLFVIIAQLVCRGMGNMRTVRLCLMCLDLWVISVFMLP